MKVEQIISRARADIAASLRAVGRDPSAINVEPLSGYRGVIRVDMPTREERRELTYAPEEQAVIVPWLLAVLAGEHQFDGDMPVAEYWREPWERENYRWTAAAHELAEAQDRAAQGRKHG